MVTVGTANITVKVLHIDSRKMTKAFFNQIQEKELFWWDEDNQLRWDWEDKEIIGWVSNKGVSIVFCCDGKIAKKTIPTVISNGEVLIPIAHKYINLTEAENIKGQIKKQYDQLFISI